MLASDQRTPYRWPMPTGPVETPLTARQAIGVKVRRIAEQARSDLRGLGLTESQIEAAMVRRPQAESGA